MIIIFKVNIDDGLLDEVFEDLPGNSQAKSKPAPRSPSKVACCLIKIIKMIDMIMMIIMMMITTMIMMINMTVVMVIIMIIMIMVMVITIHIIIALTRVPGALGVVTIA